MAQVMGLDPGLTERNPLAVVLLDVDGDRLLDHQTYTPDISLDWQARLPGVAAFLDRYFSEHPDVELIAYEIPFIGANASVGVMLAHIGGVAVALGWLHGIPVVRVRPAQAKIALQGHGNADKGMMIDAALARWGVELCKDEADAGGVALSGVELHKET